MLHWWEAGLDSYHFHTENHCLQTKLIQHTTQLIAYHDKKQMTQRSTWLSVPISCLSWGTTTPNHYSEELWEFHRQILKLNSGSFWHTWFKNTAQTPLLWTSMVSLACLRRLSVKTTHWCLVNSQNVLLGVCAIIYISIKIRHVERGN